MMTRNGRQKWTGLNCKGTVRGRVATISGIVLSCLVQVGLPVSVAMAQSAVTINGPPAGEVILNRDIEVRLAPHETSRILRTLRRGQSLNALDTPRGTSWTLIAIGGQPIGYVPSDALDPALMRRGAEPPASG